MKRIIAILLVPAVLMLLISSCLKTPPPQPYTCNYDPCRYKAPDSEIVRVQNYLDSIGTTATQHCSGLFYKIDSAGTGIAPEACGAVSVMYKGWLTNGTVFDSSSAPVSLVLAKTITGWINGIPLIKVGGKITLYIPPSLGYGKNGTGKIPPNSILIFDVSLRGVY